MADLSPNAEAVLEAALEASRYGWTIRSSLAAALRELSGRCNYPTARLWLGDIADELDPSASSPDLAAARRMLTHARETAQSLAADLDTLQRHTLPVLESRLEEIRTSLEVMARDLHSDTP